ncbi:MAG: peroxide stress protein YaaA [Anaerorhabdus sp.]
MKIIISPAKTMQDIEVVFDDMKKPMFYKEAKQLRSYLSTLKKSELKSILNASDKLIDLNYDRYQRDNLLKVPSLMSYQGLQYQHMAAHLYTVDDWEFVKKHLWIISGMYGILSPDDEVSVYRLEMQAKFKYGDFDTLEDYWSDIFKDKIHEDILNLASKEYSEVIRKNNKGKFIDVIFAVEEKEKLKVKATVAKMARGAMVSYIVKNRIEKIDDIKGFNEFNFSYRSDLSTREKFVFVKE